MSGEVVFDIETQNTYQEVGARDNALLKVSLVGAYFYATDSYKAFTEGELPKLWALFERAERLIGYNTHGFDLPVLSKYYPGDVRKFPSLDLMAEIEKHLGFRVKLDDVAQATLGVGKSGNGLQAVEYFRVGDMEKLKEYCLQDVKVTRLLYEFGRDNGKLFYVDRVGRRLEIPVDFRMKAGVSNAMNMTIGL